MATTAPMFLELEQEAREQELEETDEQLKKNNKSSLVDVEQGKKVLLAAEKGKLIDLINYLHLKPELVNFADNDGYTPLHRASYGGQIDCAKYLLRHGANIEATTHDKWTPLHCAVRWNNIEIAELLIKNGANVNAESKGGNTPLHIAASNGRYSVTCDIIQLLLYHPNCNFRIKNDSGDTAFDLAKRSGPLYKLWSGVKTIIPDQTDPWNLEGYSSE